MSIGSFGSPSSFATGLAVGSALTAAVCWRYFTRCTMPTGRLADSCKRRALQKQLEPLGSESGVYFNSIDAPVWLRGLFFDMSQRRVFLREWEDAEWRQRSGWKGTDLIHNPFGDGVQVLAYFWQAESLTLTGIVRFGPSAESHRGLCHGGAMTSLMDDLCGHICFFAGPAPWCGATVQVNCKLMKPVRVGDVHKVVGRIDRRESKEKGGKLSTKVFISADLVGEDGSDPRHRMRTRLARTHARPWQPFRPLKAERPRARRHLCRSGGSIYYPRRHGCGRRRRVPTLLARARRRAVRLWVAPRVRL